MPLRKTGGTAVPETPLEFIDGVLGLVVPIDRVPTTWERAELPSVMSVTEGRVPSVPLPGQPFEGGGQLIDPTAAPPVQRFAGDGVFLQAFHPEEAASGRGDRHTVKWIEARLGFELVQERETTFFQQTYVRLAVRDQLLFKVKDIPLFGELRMPGSEGISFLNRHAVRHVVQRVGQRSHVVLILVRIEEVREVSLLEFRQTKGFWELAEFHREKRHRVYESNTVVFKTGEL